MSTLAAEPDAGTSHGIICARRRGSARHLSIDGVPIEAVSSFGTAFSTPIAPAYIPTLARRMRESDIVIHHAPLPLTDGALLLGLPDRVGLIVYWHAEIVGYGLLKRLVSPLIRRVLTRADRIIVSGDPMIDASEFLKPHAHKCSAIPYGIRLDDWRSDEPEASTSTLSPRRKAGRHIVSLGRLVGYKGYDVLIRAMRMVDGRVTIVGEGPLLGELSRLAGEIGVAERVTFAGRLERHEIRDLFHESQIFAFPSVTAAEAFGIVQIEAMAAGLPIVNTRLPTTVPLVARHGQEALSVAPGDTEALAAALNCLLDDSELAKRLGSNGQLRATAEFDETVFRRRMADVYTDVNSERRNLLGSRGAQARSG